MSMPAAGVQTVVYGEGLMDLHATPFDKWVAYPGGAPNNVACALGKLGHPVAYVGTLGDDEYASILIAELKRSGVDISSVQMCPDNPTRGVYVKYTEDGQPVFAGYSSKGSECADAQEMENITNVYQQYPNAQVLAIGTLPLASPGSRKTQETLVAQAKERGMAVVVDLNWRNVFWSDNYSNLDDARTTIMDFVRRNASYVKASVEDLKFLIEGEECDFTSAADVLDVSFGRNVMGLLMTDGESGSNYVFRGKNGEILGHVDAFKVEQDKAIDCVGAGDAFLAGFIAETFNAGNGFDRLSTADGARNVCEFAAAVAHFVVKEKGAVGPQPSRETVERFLRDIGKTGRFSPADKMKKEIYGK